MKTHVLLIGYSKLAKKRLINFFVKKEIKISIASKSYKGKINFAFKQYKNYDKALKNSNAKIVYISLPNSLHYTWANKALNLGYHVIVDKPLCDKYSDSLSLVNLAKKKNRLISEAIFFNYHSQINKSLKLLGGKKNIYKINANFTIPKPTKGSILLSKKLKGGVVMDMGPYAANRLIDMDPIWEHTLLLVEFSDDAGKVNSYTKLVNVAPKVAISALRNVSLNPKIIVARS